MVVCVCACACVYIYIYIYIEMLQKVKMYLVLSQMVSVGISRKIVSFLFSRSFLTFKSKQYTARRKTLIIIVYVSNLS